MFAHVLFAVDLEHRASWETALPVCLEYVKAFGSTLHVMTVIPTYGQNIVSTFFPAGHEKKMMDAANQTLHEFVSEHIPKELKVQHIVGHGVAYEELLRVSEEIHCDLIIMGSHRPKIEDYLLGPNAARVVRHAKCSVLVVRQ